MTFLNQSFHENRAVGLLLTFVGGAMDAYTYFHYDAFASAQTGNLVLAIIQGSEGQWGSVLMKLMSTLFFFAGLLLAKFLIQFFRQKKIHYWRLYVLFYETLIFFVLSLPKINQHPVLVTVVIAFTASIQWITFDKINGLAYTNLFTTGNLKGMVTNFYDYAVVKVPGAKEKFFHFLSVVLAFLGGAIASVACCHWLDRYALLLPAFVLLWLALSESYFTWRFFKGDGQQLLEQTAEKN
ncbi:YoaK family protein [Enterococcus nangangensis]|uniref:YoaK family protein n=1 Tax=Enterococcus nangangensis TaxID=2559926 RepID=UPI00353132E8